MWHHICWHLSTKLHVLNCNSDFSIVCRQEREFEIIMFPFRSINVWPDLTQYLTQNLSRLNILWEEYEGLVCTEQTTDAGQSVPNMSIGSRKRRSDAYWPPLTMPDRVTILRIFQKSIASSRLTAVFQVRGWGNHVYTIMSNPVQ